MFVQTKSGGSPEHSEVSISVALRAILSVYWRTFCSKAVILRVFTFCCFKHFLLSLACFKQPMRAAPRKGLKGSEQSEQK